MAIQTGGFNVAGRGGLSFQPAAPVALPFVPGSTLASGDIGINAVVEGSRQATSNLLSGVNVALQGVLGGVMAVDERRLKREELELKYERDLAIARERSFLSDIMTPYEKERLLGQRLQNIETIRDMEDPYGKFLGEETTSPLGDIADPNAGLVPEDLPLQPFDKDVDPALPERDDQTLPPLQKTRPPGEKPAAPAEGYTTAGPGGMFIIVPISPEEGGGRMIINRATGTTTIDKGAGDKTETTAGGLPPELKDQLRLKGVTINAKGDVSTTYEPSTADADKEKDIATMQSSIEQAGRIVRDIDTIINSAQSAALPATGKFSDYLATLPVTTGASDVRSLIKNIEADVAFKTLADMRRNSKTGGALGAISDRELALLAAAEGSINPSLSWPIFKKNLEAIRDARQELLRMYSGKLGKMGAGTSASDLTSEINDLAEELDSMPDQNSAEYRDGRQRLKELVRRQRGQ